METGDAKAVIDPGGRDDAGVPILPLARVPSRSETGDVAKVVCDNSRGGVGALLSWPFSSKLPSQCDGSVHLGGSRPISGSNLSALERDSSFGVTSGLEAVVGADSVGDDHIFAVVVVYADGSSGGACIPSRLEL